jgi:hypothetical protein
MSVVPDGAKFTFALDTERDRALQTVSRFPEETRRGYAAPKSNAFTIFYYITSIEIFKRLFYYNFAKSLSILQVNA